jgi:signal transduction histidine kinase
MVKKAVEFYKANGIEKLIEEVNKPKGQFMNGSLYVYVKDMEATMLAYPVNPALIGTNIYNNKDADGKLFAKEMQDMAKTQFNGWVDYRYKNPKTNEVESKTTYYERVDEFLICCGIYKK